MFTSNMLLILMISVFLPCNCSKILCLMNTPFYSHQAAYFQLWHELVAQNHNVTLVTPNPIESNAKNLKQIDLSSTYNFVYEKNGMQHVFSPDTNALYLFYIVVMFGKMVVEQQINHPELKKLIDSDEKFDLVIVEAHLPFWFAFGARFNCPIIAVTSFDTHGSIEDYIGNLPHPYLAAQHNVRSDAMTFFVRYQKCWHHLMMIAVYHGHYWLQQDMARKYLKDPNIDLYSITHNTSLLFVSHLPGFHRMLPKVPATVILTPLHITPYKNLSGDLLEFFNGATNGVIYVSFGSSIRNVSFEEDKQQIFTNVFKRLPYKILWKFSVTPANLPDNVKIVNWAPQQDILGHEKTKLFITQGGLQSIQEATYYKVPMLVVPFFGDQFINAERIELLNMGIKLDLAYLNEEILEASLNQLLSNNSFKENLEELSVLLREQPWKSLDKAIWWIEYVIRHKGALHLRSPIIKLPFYQYFLLDVILFIAIIIVAIVGLSLKVFFMCHKRRYNDKKYQ